MEKHTNYFSMLGSYIGIMEKKMETTISMSPEDA